MLKPEQLRSAVRDYFHRAGAPPRCIALSIVQVHQLAASSKPPLVIEFKQDVPYFMGIPIAVHGVTCYVTPERNAIEIRTCDLCTQAYSGDETCPNCGFVNESDEDENG